jgi:hypothetical protein
MTSKLVDQLSKLFDREHCLHNRRSFIQRGSLDGLLDHLNAVFLLESLEERLADLPGHGGKDTLD